MAGDLYYNNVVLLVQEGTNGATSGKDWSKYNRTISQGNTASWTNAQKPAGCTTSLDLSTAANFMSAAIIGADTIGNNPVTIEWCFRLQDDGINNPHDGRYDWSYGDTPQMKPYAGYIYGYVGGVTPGSGPFSGNYSIYSAHEVNSTWYYTAWSRDASGNIKGALGDANTPGSATTNYTGSPVDSPLTTLDTPSGLIYIGSTDPSDAPSGWITCFRVTIGVARDISTVPTFPFPTFQQATLPTYGARRPNSTRLLQKILGEEDAWPTELDVRGWW